MLNKSKNNNILQLSPNIKKILYLYDLKGWAIYNVGKLWLNNLPNIETTFKDYKKLNRDDFSKYDLIWFGYLDLYFVYCIHNFFRIHDLDKCVIAVHDPLELFPQIKNWKSEKINLKKWWTISSWQRWVKLKLLKKAKYVVTCSEEMKSILKKYGVKSYQIPTMSSLPLIDKKEIITDKFDLCSVFDILPRKNIGLMKSLQDYCTNNLKTKFDIKMGTKILPLNDYIKLLDNHEIYVCTSFQEGGPLPAMDAMHRGSVVITTPVGQMLEIIKDGENGFICKEKKEFLEKIILLSGDLDLLHKMRIASREHIIKKRNEEIIRQKVLIFLKYVLEMTSKK